MVKINEDHNVSCIRCGNKVGGIFMCHGCKSSFCWKHTGEHRQELSHQMDVIIQDRDMIQEDISQMSTGHPLFHEIDQWEAKSIERIRNVAVSIRTNLEMVLKDTQEQLEISLNDLTKEIYSSRQSDEFYEIDFKRWSHRLENIRQQIKMQLKNQIVADNQLPSIPMVKICSDEMISQIRNEIASSTLRLDAEPLLDNRIQEYIPSFSNYRLSGQLGGWRHSQDVPTCLSEKENNEEHRSSSNLSCLSHKILVNKSNLSRFTPLYENNSRST